MRLHAWQATDEDLNGLNIAGMVRNDPRRAVLICKEGTTYTGASLARKSCLAVQQLVKHCVAAAL